ncbi:MAG: hypothetical protein IT445_14010 [Phycisphaeraceae bacterium]|nr:hypothetical protein [Phycisphaeraceae bacterium]
MSLQPDNQSRPEGEYVCEMCRGKMFVTEDEGVLRCPYCGNEIIDKRRTRATNRAIGLAAALRFNDMGDPFIHAHIGRFADVLS